MPTSFVVVPPERFRAPHHLETLDHLFANSHVTLGDIARNIYCTIQEAENLITFLCRQGYGTFRYYHSEYFFDPKLPITFVASLDARKQFAREGKR